MAWRAFLGPLAYLTGECDKLVSGFSTDRSRVVFDYPFNYLDTMYISGLVAWSRKNSQVPYKASFRR